MPNPGLSLTPVPIAPGRPTLPGFQDLADVWHAKRGDRLLPARGDFDMPSLRPWLGFVNFSLLTDDGPFFTLFGSRNAQLLGVDLTRRYLVANVDPARRARTLAQYRQLAALPAAGVFEGMSVIQDTSFMEITVVALPLGQDGWNVSGFLHYLHFGAPQRRAGW